MPIKVVIYRWLNSVPHMTRRLVAEGPKPGNIRGTRRGAMTSAQDDVAAALPKGGVLFRQRYELCRAGVNATPFEAKKIALQSTTTGKASPHPPPVTTHLYVTSPTIQLGRQPSTYMEFNYGYGSPQEHNLNQTSYLSVAVRRSKSCSAKCYIR